jgi:Ca2+-binding RTX toxin-like protein
MNILGDLEIVDSVADFATAPELDGARTIATTTINGTVYVYVASRYDNGIQIFTLGGDGTLTPISSVTDTSNTALDGAVTLKVVEKAGTSYLVVAGFDNDGLSVFEIDGNGADIGTLTLRDTIYNGGGNALDGALDTEVFQAGHRSFVVTTSYYSDAVSVYELDASGSLTLVDLASNSDDPGYQLDGADGVSIHAIGNKTFMYVVGEAERGLSVFEISNTGQLTHVTDVTGLNGNSGSYSGIEAGSFHGRNYLIVPDHSDGHFLVYSLAANGVPTLVHNYDARVDIGSIGQGNIYLDIIEIDGVNFIIAGSFNADSVNVYTLDDAGQMSLVRSIASSQLDGAHDVEHVNINGKHFIIATAFNGDRVTVVEIGGGDEVISGTAENDRMVGLSGDDDMIGRGGNDLIKGGDGNDVLSGRKGNDSLFGGNGEDVLIGGIGNDLLNGGAGRDVLLGGVGQDTLSYAGSDARVVIDLLAGTASGGHATGDYFADIEHLTGSAHNDQLTGDNGANEIEGGAGNDYISGGKGRDKLDGGDGSDTVEGGDGGDRLSLGSGSDTGRGGTGNDRISGGKGNDSLFGEAGNDTLVGSQGNDRLTGGTGDDTLTGGRNNDVFVFGNGFNSDTITDFTVNQDRIDLSANSNLNSFAQVQASSFEFGGNTVIADGANSIQLIGVSKSDLDAADFIF